MYYNYKSKKKKRKLIKILLLLPIIFCVYYFGTKYHQYIFFWKYTHNKISNRLNNVLNIRDTEKKKTELGDLEEICSDYCFKNQLSAESFLLLGKIHFYIGEAVLNTTFSDMIINNCTDCVSREAKNEFLNAVRDIRKSMALSRSEKADSETLLILAKSIYYSNYYNTSEIHSILKKIDVEFISNADDIRFLSIINIFNKNEDYGLEILNKYGMISDSIKSRFFLAYAYNLADKYTDSIMSFKNILNNCSDKYVIKLVNLNLGKIYFSQSLFKESLTHFTNALTIDKKDNTLKIWIGKNYSAMGEKTKAKAIWAEVLASDQTNAEAKKLLGLM